MRSWERQRIFEPNPIHHNRVLKRLRLAKRDWETKWQRFKMDSLTTRTQHSWIAVEELHNRNRLQLRLRQANVCCTSPLFTPLAHNVQQLEAIIASALLAGIPVVFWSRRRQSVRSDLEQHLLCHHTNDLLDQINQIRNDALSADSDDHVGKHLFVMWDDPHRRYPRFRLNY